MSIGPSLATLGLHPSHLHHDLVPAALVEAAVARREGRLTEHGALLCLTGPHTGRSPKDRFIVRDAETAARVDFGAVNQPLEPARYLALLADVKAHFNGRETFVQDCFVGASPDSRLSVRVIALNAWHAFFARNMFLRPGAAERATFAPNFTLLHAGDFQADPARHGTRTGDFCVIDLTGRTILIGGTQYAGEIKKAMFSAMNYFLPQRGVLSMHCAANLGSDDDVAVFFGLSGTGKTSLSADPERRLIGDDEHGWDDHGVFNLEGGCYAKAIRLSAEAEPDIWATTRKFGTILENVVMDERTRALDLDSDALTENTRASYEIDRIANSVPDGRGGHPQSVIFLTADAFGVLPPLSRLTPEQAAYHFLSGYTAKVAGTEVGVKEPQATFSACFGAAFMPLHPSTYARLLTEKLARHGVKAWLINTGWTGGPYGVGSRIPIRFTRQMVRAALAGVLDQAAFVADPVFGVEVPRAIPGVPAELLQPRATWSDGAKYDAQAARLSAMFRQNFEKYAAQVEARVREAGPAAR